MLMSVPIKSHNRQCHLLNLDFTLKVAAPIWTASVPSTTNCCNLVKTPIIPSVFETPTVFLPFALFDQLVHIEQL